MAYRRIAALAIVAAFSPSQGYAQPDKGKPLEVDAAASVGAYAVDLGSGKAIWEYNANRWLTPASVTKLLTTGAALATKGGDARLHTKIELSQDSAGGKILCVRGEYDPTTSSRYFNKRQLSDAAKKIAEKLKNLGISELSNIIVDDSRACQDAASPKCLWEDMGNHYGAAPTIVTIYDNNGELYYSTPQASGELCRLDSVVPDLAGLKPRTYIKTHASAADKSQIYMGGDDTWYATGFIPCGRKSYRLRGAMPHPTTQYGKALSELLRQNGISVSRYETGAAGAGEEVMIIESPTIAEIIKVTNHESVNLFADGLAFNMAMSKNAAGAVTWESAADAVMSFWREKAGLEMNLDDGSGLSPQGAVSAKTIVAAISYMRRSGEWAAYKSSLPTAGRSGTAQRLGHGTELSGRARVKSGTMTGVMAYAGVLTTRQGREVAFCIMVNHYKETQGNLRAKIADWLIKIYNDKK